MTNIHPDLAPFDFDGATLDAPVTSARLRAITDALGLKTSQESPSVLHVPYRLELADSSLLVATLVLSAEAGTTAEESDAIAASFGPASFVAVYGQADRAFKDDALLRMASCANGWNRSSRLPTAICTPIGDGVNQFQVEAHLPVSEGLSERALTRWVTFAIDASLNALVALHDSLQPSASS